MHLLLMLMALLLGRVHRGQESGWCASRGSAALHGPGGVAAPSVQRHGNLARRRCGLLAAGSASRSLLVSFLAEVSPALHEFGTQILGRLQLLVKLLDLFAAHGQMLLQTRVRLVERGLQLQARTDTDTETDAEAQTTQTRQDQGTEEKGSETHRGERRA